MKENEKGEEGGFPGAIRQTEKQGLLKNQSITYSVPLLLTGVKADVFSLGIILSELLIGDYPFDAYEKSNNSAEQESTLDSFDRAIIDGLRPIIPDKCPPKLRKLIQVSGSSPSLVSHII